MAIPEGHKDNFETMQRASEDGQLALMECTRKSDGEKVYVICAVNWNPDEEEEYEFIPIAKLFDGNPYDEVLPPTIDDAVELDKASIVEVYDEDKYKREGDEDGTQP